MYIYEFLQGVSRQTLKINLSLQREICKAYFGPLFQGENLVQIVLMEDLWPAPDVFLGLCPSSVHS